MRKSGLHKQISSIFDGVPLPSSSGSLEDAGMSSEPTGPLTQDAPEPDALQEMPTQTSDSAILKRLTANSSECESDPTPAVQAGRPMPLSKSKAVSKSGMKPSYSTQIKQAIFKSHASLDPRQKKAGMLVGVLSVVFGVVMFITLGGIGKTQAVAADATSGNQTTQVPRKTAEEWKRPDPLPKDLRNATSPVTVHSDTALEDTSLEDTSMEDTSMEDTPQVDQSIETHDLIVKGIVFSKNNPSAIVNDQIISEGQTFNGVTVIKITKESVEFEANEKRWTQFVQRQHK